MRSKLIRLSLALVVALTAVASTTAPAFAGCGELRCGVI